MSTTSGSSEHKIAALCRYWRTDLSSLFMQDMSAFLEDLPERLLSESESYTTARQQDYLDIITMLRRENNQVKSGASTAITITIEEFAHLAKSANTQRAVPSNSLSLIDADDIEVTVVVEGLAARASTGIHDVLYDAFLRINQLIPSITQENQLPCHPRSLIQAMLDTFATLSLSSAQKVILAKLFVQQISTDKLADIVQSTLDSANIPKHDQTIKNLDRGNAAPKRKKTIEELVNDLSSVNLKAVGQSGSGGKVDSAGVGKETEQVQKLHVDSQNQTGQPPSNATGLIEQLGSLRKLRKKMSSMPIAPAPKNPLVAEQEVETTELNSLLGKIQLEQPTKTVREDSSIQSVGEIRNQIRAQLKSDDTLVQTLKEKDTDTINLVSLMFDYILDNPNLPTAMKALLARLQIPMLRVALLSPEFFSTSHHPARKLLDKLSKAGISWDKAGDKDSYYDKLEGIVFRILKEFRDDVTIFDTLYDELQKYLDAQEKNVKRVVSRTLNTENKRAQTTIAKKEIQNQLNARLVGKKLPLAVVKILQQGWWHVLYHTFIRHGNSSTQWKNALKVADALIWSVTKPSGKTTEWLKQVSAIRQKLMDNLQKGLVQVNYDEIERTKLMDGICTIHEKILKKQDIADLEVEVTEQKPVGSQAQDGQAQHDPAQNGQAQDDQIKNSQAKNGQTQEVQASPIQQPSVSALTQDAKLEVVGSHAVALPAKDDADAGLDTIDDSLRQIIDMVNDIAVGTWLEFDVDSDTPKRYKLVAVIRSLNRMVFTNRRGIKVAEISRLALARKLQAGQARILEEDDHLVESALNSVMSEMGP